MRTLGLILARAGSKGLPGKNARPVAGRPMLAWTIDHARGSRRLDAVALSTDGAALASIGEAAGVTVLRRGADLSHDTAPVDAAARDALARLGEEFGGPFDAVAILYGNVPVRPADLTDRALAKLADTGCDSVQSVCPVGKAHAYWMKRLGGAGGDALEPYHDSPVYRRQDLPPLYLLDGGALVVTAGSLARVVPGERSSLSRNPYPARTLVPFCARHWASASRACAGLNANRSRTATDEP